MDDSSSQVLPVGFPDPEVLYFKTFEERGVLLVMAVGKELCHPPSGKRWGRVGVGGSGRGRGGFEQINTQLKSRIYIITIGCNTVIGMH